ncbi:hypothetical protein KFK09_014899 [Dendrobium nobile]|uniref:Integrase catalytic domain-containing protein n=1 Tax=Dendrobium nobile TaxID=94219 RepID=A0A8T3B4C7_DENNO|nr:hypothetical protein KFK09_014899 [Dendrobium nobile]
MLDEYSLPKYFWAEAVNIAYYVLNRVNVRAKLDKTPYEILKGRTPNLSHLHVFGCKVLIHNNRKSHLGKFDPKSDEGVFLGYSSVGKSFRMFNKRTLMVEETTHIVFDESDPRKPGVEDDDDVGEITTGVENLEKGVEHQNTKGVGDVTQGVENVDLEERVGPSHTLPRDWRYSTSHPKDLILGDPSIGVRTRHGLRKEVNHSAFISMTEPTNINQTLSDEFWILAMSEELNQFVRNDVWELIERPTEQSVVGTKCVLRIRLEILILNSFNHLRTKRDPTFLYSRQHLYEEDNAKVKRRSGEGKLKKRRRRSEEAGKAILTESRFLASLEDPWHQVVLRQPDEADEAPWFDSAIFNWFRDAILMKFFPVEVLFWTDDFCVSSELNSFFPDFCLSTALCWLGLASVCVGCSYHSINRFLNEFFDISNLKMLLQEILCWFFVTSTFLGSNFVLGKISLAYGFSLFYNWIESVLDVESFVKIFEMDGVLGVIIALLMILMPLVMEIHNSILVGDGNAAIWKEVFGFEAIWRFSIMPIYEDQVLFEVVSWLTIVGAILESSRTLFRVIVWPMVSSHKRPHESMWYLDSRCSRHMTGDANQFILLETRIGGKVTLGDNTTKKVVGVGIIAPRTPQQNGVAERKNQILVEAARAMLDEYSLPKYFWAEAVNIAYYVLNRVNVRAKLDKTPYEILKGRTPNLSHLHVFGCKVLIHNNRKSHLGKFDPKSDEGVFLGYSSVGKSFRMFNKRTLMVEETTHIVFDESDPRKPGVEDDDDVGEITTGVENLEKGVEHQNTKGVGDVTQGVENVDLEERVGPSHTLPRDWRYSTSHPKDLILGDPSIGVRTRHGLRKEVNHSAFISMTEPTNINQTLSDEFWILAMSEELNQFVRNDVWELIERPTEQSVVGTKCVLRISHIIPNDIYIVLDDQTTSLLRLLANYMAKVKRRSGEGKLKKRRRRSEEAGKAILTESRFLASLEDPWHQVVLRQPDEADEAPWFDSAIFNWFRDAILMKFFPVEVLFWTDDFCVSSELNSFFPDFCLSTALCWLGLASVCVGCSYHSINRFLNEFFDISNLKMLLQEILCWFFVTSTFLGSNFVLGKISLAYGFSLFYNWIESVLDVESFVKIFEMDGVLGVIIALLMILMPLVMEIHNSILVGDGNAAIWKEVFGFEAIWRFSIMPIYEDQVLFEVVSWLTIVGAIVIDTSSLFGSSKGQAHGSNLLRRLLVDVCNDEVVVWSLVFQLFFEVQVLLVNDLKVLKVFGLSLVNAMRMVMIISSVGFDNDEVGYWLLEVVVSVMVLHWNINGVVLAIRMTMLAKADSWTIEETVGVIAFSWLIGSFLMAVVGCLDATSANSTSVRSLLDPKIVGGLVDVWKATTNGPGKTRNPKVPLKNSFSLLEEEDTCLEGYKEKDSSTEENTENTVKEIHKDLSDHIPLMTTEELEINKDFKENSDNSRGLKKKEASHYLKECIKDNDLVFVGLSETNISSFDRKDCDKFIGKLWVFYSVSVEGLSGGLMVCWRKDLASFSTLVTSSQAIIGELNIHNKGTWIIASIYGGNDSFRRKSLWNTLEGISNSNLPIIIGGDFNCLSSQKDKLGGKKFKFTQGRRNSNWIHQIKGEDGRVTADQVEIENIFFKFFSNKWDEKDCCLS